MVLGNPITDALDFKFMENLCDEELELGCKLGFKLVELELGLVDSLRS